MIEVSSLRGSTLTKLNQQIHVLDAISRIIRDEIWIASSTLNDSGTDSELASSELSNSRLVRRILAKVGDNSLDLFALQI